MPVASSRASASKDDEAAWPRGRRVPLWAQLLVGLLATFAVVSGGIRLVLGTAPSLEGPLVRGVRLGMTPDVARAAFADAPFGAWSDPPGCCGLTLEWTRSGPTSTQWARFEFHDGLLVAIRLLADAPIPSAKAQYEVTPSFVSAVGPGAGGGTKTTVLARGCSTHATEAQQLMALAGESP